MRESYKGILLDQLAYKGLLAYKRRPSGIYKERLLGIYKKDLVAYKKKS